MSAATSPGTGLAYGLRRVCAAWGMARCQHAEQPPAKRRGPKPAIEVRHRKPGTKLDNRKDGRYAGRVRLAVVLDRSAESLCVAEPQTNGVAEGSSRAPSRRDR